jgi:opacity protein-like surface antigen
MTRKPFGFALAAVLAAMTGVTAQAAEVIVEEETTAVETTTEAAPEFGGSSPYVSAGAVYAVEMNDSDLDSGVNHYGDLDNSGGYDLRLGYNFPRMAAVEIQWQSLVNFDTDGVDPVTLNDLPTVEARMLSVNGRFSPLTGRIQPYLLFGLGWYNVQADRQSVSVHESAFASRFGIGVAAYITQRTGLAFEAGYILPMTGGVISGSDRFDLIPMTLSVFFRFK